MKKLKLFITVFILCFSLLMTKAQPLFIANASSGQYEYTITTYLYYTKVGDLCTINNWAFPFTFGPGALLTINDGSFVWNNSVCLSEPLDGTCNPSSLEWYGQRVYDVVYTSQPDWWDFWGGIAKSTVVPCYFGDQDQLSYPLEVNTPAGGDWSTLVQGDYSAVISEENGIPVATILYMDWVAFRNLQFN